MFSDHALERLKDRYEIENKIDVNNIKKRFFTKPHYNTIALRESMKCIRQIKYKGNEIQAVVDPVNHRIITILPSFVHWEGEYTSFDLLCVHTRKILIENKRLKKENKKLKNKPKIKKYLQINKWFIGKEIT
jgi:hypothetical protein